jgi:hypothetical protein
VVDQSSSNAWFAVVGALGAVLLTGTIGLATAALNHRWNEQARARATGEQDTRTIRKQRRQACHHYLVATNLFYQTIDQVYRKAQRGEEFDHREQTRAAVTSLQDKYVYLTISTGADVRELARAYNRVLYALEDAARAADDDAWPELQSKAHRAREQLRAAMRSELGVVD